MKGCTPDVFELSLEASPHLGIRAREFEFIEDRSGVERRPAHEDRRDSSGPAIGDDLASHPLELRNAGDVANIGDVDQMMRDATALLERQLCSADIHSPIDLHRIGVDDLATDALGQIKREIALTCCGGTHDRENGNRRHERKSRKHQPEGAQVMTAQGRFVSAIALGAAGLMLAGCTQEPQVVGRMGITSDGNGNVVLVLAPCGGFIDTITLSLLPYGKQTQSGTVGEWKSDASLRTTTRLSLNGPKLGWVGGQVTTQPQQHYIASAGSSTHHDDAFPDLTFGGDQVATLDPSKVYVNSEDPDSSALVARPLTSFQSWACGH